MTLEIIIIALCTIAALLAAILAVHNILELQDTRSELDAFEAENFSLQNDIDAMESECRKLERELEAERKNSKELRRIIIDYEIAVNSRQEEPELQASESNESALSSQSDDVLQTDATKLKERLPEGHTNVISGMPYTSITDKKSEQWALQLQAYTGKYGIRCYFDGEHIYFLSAMGSAYGRTIGDTFRVTLRCGTVMYVMLAEFKDDGMDPNFFGHPTTHADGYDVTCVLEFIYDAANINSKALQAGNFCNIECFGGLHGYGGDIVKIENLGRKWKP